ncbi:MAG: hypothetical protein VX640_14240 [Pseudomonadota bacterium]|nr:hypothetical protein [Pseudomonadota bacterium]
MNLDWRLIDWELTGGLVEAAGLVAAALVAAFTYRANLRQRRAEWLYKLFEKFYENRDYKPMRRLLDYQPEDEIAALRRDIDANVGSENVEALVDYLNFFELIAIQVKDGQISEREVVDIFDYYIRRLFMHDFIMKYIDEQGFENLARLVRSLQKGSRKK